MLNLSLAYNRIPEASLLAFLESARLTERLAGKASELVVTFCDLDRRFSQGAYKAVEGDSLSISLDDLPAERYAIQAIEVSLKPRVTTWHCVARPKTTKSPAGRGGGSQPPHAGALVDTKKSWGTQTDLSLRRVCEKICEEAGLALSYRPANNPLIPVVARYNETGFNLITRLCRRYGFGVHATSDRLTILPAKASQDKAGLPTLIQVQANQIKNMIFSSSMRPQKLESARFDPRSQALCAKSFGEGDAAPLSLDFDLEDSEALWLLESQKAHLCGIEVVPDARFMAGAVLELEGDRYQIAEMTYERTAASEAMSLALKRVL